MVELRRAELKHELGTAFLAILQNGGYDTYAESVKREHQEVLQKIQRREEQRYAQILSQSRRDGRETQDDHHTTDANFNQLVGFLHRQIKTMEGIYCVL